MYKSIRVDSSSASRMQALRTSYRALGARPAHMTYAARASTRANAKAEGDMAQSDVVKLIASRLNYDPTDVATVVNETLDVITQTVANGNKVAFKGFGTFKRTETSARKGRNPQTGAELSLPASARPAFTAAKAFKDGVKENYEGPSK